MSNRISLFVCALFALICATYATKASADTNFSFRIGIVQDSPYYGPHFQAYVENGYNSGYWYMWDRPVFLHRWNPYYGGYDCEPAFMFGYDGGRRARYEAILCFDDFGGYFVVPHTWHRLAYFNDGFWFEFDGRRWRDHHWDWNAVRAHDRDRWHTSDRYHYLRHEDNRGRFDEHHHKQNFNGERGDFRRGDGRDSRSHNERRSQEHSGHNNGRHRR